MLLGLLLVSTVFGAIGETTINDYLVDIRDSALISVRSTARSSEQLNLSGLGLERLKKYAFANATNIKILNLANNSIVFPPTAVFSNLSHLEHLSLADNVIRRLTGAFVGLGNLKTLNISNNPIKVLEQGAFHGLSKTIEIFVRGNSLTKICTDVFSQTNSSKKLLTIPSKNRFIEEDGLCIDHDDPPKWARDFRIKLCMDQGKVTLLERTRRGEVLQSGCISKVQGRCSLHLDDLDIKDFEPAWYRVEDYRHMIISEMSMRGNKIDNLDQFTNYPLVNVSRLRTLDISDNRITILRRNSLRDLRHLRYLHLSKNRIRTLEPGCFEDLQNLRILKLRKNEIDHVDAGMFGGLSRLWLLDLGENRLTRITEGFRSLPDNLNTLKLDRNLIGSLENGSFVNVPKTLLNLENNRIASIAKWSFNVPEDLVREPAFKTTSADLAWAIANPLSSDYLVGASQLVPTNIKLSGNPFARLENGALFTFPRDRHNYVYVERNSIELIQGGLFDDGNRRAK